MLLTQMLQVIKLLGLRRAATMKKRHERALPLIRGYAATTCFWTLLNVGFWDDLAAAPGGSLDLAEYCRKKGFDPHVLGSVCSYLDGIRLVDLTHPRPSASTSAGQAADGSNAGGATVAESVGTVRLTKRSRELLEEPRGLFELLYAYEPVFVELEPMLRGQKKYGPDVRRRTRWVGLGSGRLCRQLPYPVMMDMVRRHGRKCVLDLGCGDGAFLTELARLDPSIRGIGIDIDEPTVQLANEHIAVAGLSDRLTATVADMFDLATKEGDGAGEKMRDRERKGDSPHGGSAERQAGDGIGTNSAPSSRHAEGMRSVDCLTACDTFHEYLWTGDERIVNLLADLKAAFPNALMVVGEFCKQSHESLRKRPTAFLEHHLFHQLTNQRIESASRWRDLFAKAGLMIREEKVFDLVGHGYFVLQ